MLNAAEVVDHQQQRPERVPLTPLFLSPQRQPRAGWRPRDDVKEGGPMSLAPAHRQGALPELQVGARQCGEGHSPATWDDVGKLPTLQPACHLHTVYDSGTQEIRIGEYWSRKAFFQSTSIR